MANALTSGAPRERAASMAGRLLWVLGGAAALLSGTLGCFGDVQIERSSSVRNDLPDATTESEPLQPSCTAGEIRCEGPWLERCDGGGSEARWNKVEDCGSEALCDADAGRCVRAACEPGAPRCEREVAQVCRADLTGWQDVASCESAAHCSLDEAKCAAEGQVAPCCLTLPCEPDELRCNDRQLQRCRSDQSDLDLVDECLSAELCRQGLAVCAADPESCACADAVCQPGETRCSGLVLERCNAGQTGWEFVEECASEALCQLGRERSPLSCEPVKCDVGEYDCTALGELMTCNADRTAFELQQLCPGGAAYCNSGLGRCMDTPCQPGQRACIGAQIQVCRADQTGFDAVAGTPPCATPQLCVDDGLGQAVCEQPACQANEVVCAGEQLQRCNEGRTGYVNIGPPCLRSDLCNASLQRCDFCVASRRECTPDLTASRTCNPAGTAFGPLTPCPLGCIASTGACRTCTIGEYRCEGGLLERCNDGVSFTPLNRAADCSGATRVVCGASGVQSAPCGAGLTCSGPGQCTCSPGQAACDGDQLLTCNATGTALVPGERCGGPDGRVLRSCDDGTLTSLTCASAVLCSVAAGPACPECVGNQGACSGTGEPLQCQGGQLVPAPACGVGFSCEGSGICLCTAGALRCDDGELFECSPSRTSFVAAARCGGAAGATLRTCDGSQLLQTTCDSPELCAAATGSVCPACSPDAPPACADGNTELRCVGGQSVEVACPLGLLCIDGIGCLVSAD